MSQSYETSEPILHCYNHPDRVTSLRCNRCERPMCTSCAVLTPTGYRCKECVRGLSKTFDTSKRWDYPLAFVIAAALSYLGSLVIGYLGFFALFVAPVIGVGIAEVIRWSVRKRRSRLLWQVSVTGVVVGCLVRVLPLVFISLGGGSFPLFFIVWQAVYLFLVPSTVYYRLSGIQMRI